MWPSLLKTPTRPWGLRWRSSMWYATFVVFLGLMCDTIVYSTIIPVMPFQLKRMGYHDIPSLLGWLLFAYSIGVVLSTPPLASCSERFKNRRIPLVLALLILILSQLLLLLARRYWIMCFARIIQGISSSAVLTVGLALLCDTTPKKHIGRQLGIAMAGFSVGFVAGPPVAGTLYANYGYKAPFYFGIAIAGVDLIARILVVERKDAIRWGVDPAADPVRTQILANESSRALFAVDNGLSSVGSLIPSTHTNAEGTVRSEISVNQAPPDDATQHTITPLDVLLRLVTSPRAVVCVFSTFVYGLVYTGQESVLVLHISHVYNLDPSRAGLAFIAAVAPTLISMPITGYFADNRGAEWVSLLALLFGIPWWGAITLNGSLTQFLVIFAFETLFTSGLVSPLMTELAAVSRSIEGVGYAHVYGSFNLAYGIGSCVGPVLCGQIYGNVENAWTVISLMTLGLLVVCLFLSITFTGERPLLQRVLGPSLNRGKVPLNAWDMKVFGKAPPPGPGDPVEPYPGTSSAPVPQPAHVRVR